MHWRDKGISCDTVVDVELWARERRLIDQGNSLSQADKTLEEAGELRDAIASGDEEAAKDEIGDVLITLIIQTRIRGLTLQECLEHSYDKIRNRTGKLVNGTFVKSEDLQEGEG